MEAFSNDKPTILLEAAHGASGVGDDNGRFDIIKRSLRSVKRFKVETAHERPR